MRPGVFIAMPVYLGTEFIEESIRSILAQTFEDFHLVMSVDGDDDQTIEVCRKYSDDPRVDVVVQEQRLGWPGNFNWLVTNCDREFFCYWQQDDLASTTYLESLRRELASRPDASIAYTDVQWFGAKFHRDSTPSIEGTALARVMQHIEAIRYEPLRGLMRSADLPRDKPAIPETRDESCQEEFVFLAHMAAAGAFIRVDSAMYFKRLHTANAFERWLHFPEWRRRRGWISMGAGMYDIARSVAPDELSVPTLAQILDRLAVNRLGRGYFYLPPQSPEEQMRLTRDFVAYAGLDRAELGVSNVQTRGLERPVARGIIDGLEYQKQAFEELEVIADSLSNLGTVTLEMGQGVGTCLLGYGWSNPEPWGVWTESDEATLNIPAPPGRKWEALLTGRALGSEGTWTIGSGTEDGRVRYQSFELPTRIEVAVHSDGTAGSIRLELPSATSPSSLGLSSDTRFLGFGLEQLQISLE